MNHVLGVTGYRRVIEIGAVAYEGEISVGPPKPITGLVTFDAGEGWAPVPHDAFGGKGVLQGLINHGAPQRGLAA